MTWSVPICWLLLLLSWKQIVQSSDAVELYAFGVERESRVARVVYASWDWPGDFDGFLVYRRELMESGNRSEWQVVTTSPLLPCAIPEIDWKNLDPLPAEQERLKRWGDALMNAEAPNCLRLYLDGKNFDSVAGTDRGRDIFTLAYENFWKRKEFDYALLYNIGCVDRGLEPEKDYEYGIFPMINDKIGERPLQTAKAFHEAPRDFEGLSFRVTKCERQSADTMIIRWDMDESTCRQLGITRCRVLRAPLGKAAVDFKPIFTSIGSVRRKSGKRSFFHQGSKRTFNCDPSEDYVFKIVPVTVFNKELPVSWRAEYRPKKEKDKE